MENGKGTFVITSHLGNIELLRGLASFNRTGVSRNVPVTAIVDIKVTGQFNHMINQLNFRSSLDIISVQDIGPSTAVLLEEKLARGEMVTIAGDRTAVGTSVKNLMFPFLGDEAPFSPGAFYLAAMMKAPVYCVFALRRGDLSLKPEYDMYVRKSQLSFDCGRKERYARSSELASFFARLLEGYCKEKPFQWYNFYNFWAKEA
jgi:predicted LPLAT superfamily acyltransferase